MCVRVSVWQKEKEARGENVEKGAEDGCGVMGEVKGWEEGWVNRQ